MGGERAEWRVVFGNCFNAELRVQRDIDAAVGWHGGA